MKKIILISVLFLLLISISSVSANDDLNQNITKIDDVDNQIEINEQDVLSASSPKTFMDLQSQIAATSAGNTLTLYDDYEYTAGTDRDIGIAIYSTTKNIVIDGNGHTLNGKNAARILYVNSGATNIVVKNINFVNGYHTNGAGAIYWAGESGTVTNCTFTSDTSDKSGGAILWTAAKGTITNNKFEKCKSNTQSGGAIYCNDQSTQTTISNNVFSQNSVKTCGAGIGSAGANTIISNNNFTDNKADESGAAIYTSGKNTKILNNRFIRNTAESGGAVYIEIDGITMDGCYFEDNHITGGGGGAMRWNGNSGTMTNCEFKDNTAATRGGAVYWNGDNAKMENNIFTKNVADTAAGGALVYWGNNGQINSNTFQENAATKGYGGALYVDGNSNKVNNNKFNKNTAAKGGGAIYYHGTSGSATSNTITENTAENAAGIRWDGNSATITGNTFKGNINKNGANIIYGDGSKASVTKNTFFNNKATDNCIKWTSADAVISDNIYKDDSKSSLTMKNLVVNYGTNQKLVATLTNSASQGIANKKVTITLNNKNTDLTTDSNGQVSLDISKINVGTYPASAKFAGDSEYNAATATATVTINKAPTKTVLNLSKELYVGEDIKITAKVNATEGQVTFKIEPNSDPKTRKLVNGEATLLIPAGFIAGEYGVTATYESEGNYLTSSAKDKFTVNKLETTLTISNVDMYLGGKGNAVFTLMNCLNKPVTSATIYVSFHNNDSTLTTDSNGKATLELEGLDIGTYQITALYKGNKDHYLNSTATSTVTVKSTIESKDLTAEIGNVKYNATFFDTNGKPLAKGQYVSFTVENDVYRVQVENNGVATATINKGVGEYTITSVNTVTGESRENKLKITKVSPNLNVKTNNITEGENAIFDITTKATATGNVTLTINQKDYKETLVNGKAKITVSNLTSGKYPYTVKYEENGNYSAQSVTGTLNVKSDNVIITAPDVSKYYGGPERLSVKLTDKTGAPLANQTVFITINGVEYKRTTDKTGSTDAPLGLISGNYTADIVFKGNTEYKGVNTTCDVEIKTTIIAEDLYKIEKSAKPFTAKVLDSNGKVLPKGTSVYFNINGVLYERSVGDNGEVKLNINLMANTYIITTINAKTGESVGNTVVIQPRIVNNSDVTKYYRNGTQYHVTILNDDGNPVKAGENVTFNINGVFYTRQTDANGIATLNINLQQGDYIITAIYKNCMVSNKIKVLPVLSAKDMGKKYGEKTPFVANLVDGQGKAFANQTITFNINGVFYNRATDDSGNAELNINLMPGIYIITSTYNGGNIANIVTIRA